MKRLYRILLRIYPAGFREEYAPELERQFSDEYREAEGRRERIRLSLRALADVAATAPAEISRELRQDLRYAARIYRQRPVATALALAALALAIGATTGIFSVLNALLIRSLPFREPERLVELSRTPVREWGRNAFNTWRSGSQYLEDAAVYSPQPMNIAIGRESLRVTVCETTASFLRVLGTEPELGRGFSAGEDVPSRGGVAVIGYGLWQQAFGGDPRVIGSTIRVNGAPLTVIGVAPRNFDFPDQTAVWTPTAYGYLGSYFWGQHIGRLKPGVSFKQASLMYQADFAQGNAGRPKPARESEIPRLSPLQDQLAGPVRVFLAGFALLVAALGAYGAASYSVSQRTHEIGIRIAVGGPPGRVRGMVFRQSMAPVLAGAVAGLAGAAWLGRFLKHLMASAEPTGIGMCTSAAIAIVAATACAIWTATSRVVRTEPTAALRAE